MKWHDENEEHLILGQIAEDRAFAAEIRREYGNDARDYASFPEVSGRVKEYDE